MPLRKFLQYQETSKHSHFPKIIENKPSSFYDRKLKSYFNDNGWAI